MPRKLLYNSKGGGFGLEGHFNSMLRMSVAAMFATNVKNERERFLHRRTMAQIHIDRRDAVHSMDREIKKIRRELTDMSAHRAVYRQNSFIKWEEQKSGTIKQVKKDDSTVQRRENDSQRFPPIQNFSSTFSDSNREGESKMAPEGESTAPPSISSGSLFMWRSMVPHTSVTLPKTPLNENQVKFVEVVEEDVKTADKKVSNGNKKKSKDKVKHSVNVRKLKLRERQHDKVSSVLPQGCKGVYFVQRFLDKETERLLQEMSPSNIRRKKAESLIKSVPVPGFINARRSTSAIMREFTVYRSNTDLSPKIVQPL